MSPVILFGTRMRTEKHSSRWSGALLRGKALVRAKLTIDKVVSSNCATTVQFAQAKRRCPFERGKRACEGSLIAESRPKSHLCQAQFGFAKQILGRVDPKFDEPLMH